MAALLYGTSSWSEKSWVGAFYPEGTDPRGYLAYYATRFDAVEADVTYYRIPSERMVERWALKVPDGFELAAKFPRSIVHCGEGPVPDPDTVLVPERVGADTEAFLQAMSLMGSKLGPLVLQFPYFRKEAFPEPGPFLERLDAYLGNLPRRLRIAVEVRNHWWIRPPLLDILRRNNAALVLVELSYMPHPADLWRKHDLLTADFAYARLIGDRKAVQERTDTFDKLVLDRSGSQRRWAQLLKRVLERVPRAYVFANNHYAGHGPATIQDLAQAVLGA